MALKYTIYIDGIGYLLEYWVSLSFRCNRNERYKKTKFLRYWYWVVLGCFRTIGIVKGFSKYWYWYWVLLRAFESIGIAIVKDF